MAKKQRGGQPGNHNAQTHGFYSAGLNAATRNVLRRARNADAQLYEEIALARAHLFRLLQLEPENHDILVRMLNTIARLAALNHNMGPAEERQLGGALQELLAELLPG